MSADNIGISLDKYADDNLLSTLVRYGLLIGGIFQVVCLASAVLMTGDEALPDGNDDINASRVISEPVPPSTARRFHKTRKLEKKKRR